MAEPEQPLTARYRPTTPHSQSSPIGAPTRSATPAQSSLPPDAYIPIHTDSKSKLVTELRAAQTQLLAQDWQKTNLAASRCFRLAQGYVDKAEFVECFMELRPAFATALGNLRSAVVKHLSMILEAMCESIGAPFAPFAEQIFPAVIPIACGSQGVLCDAAHGLLINLLRVTDPSRVLPHIVEGLRDKRNASLRVKCSAYMEIILQDNLSSSSSKVVDLVCQGLNIGLVDANGEVRRAARQSFERANTLWPSVTRKLYSTFDSALQKRLGDICGASTTGLELLSPRPASSEALPRVLPSPRIPRPHSAMSNGSLTDRQLALQNTPSVKYPTWTGRPRTTPGLVESGSTARKHTALSNGMATPRRSGSQTSLPSASVSSRRTDLGELGSPLIKRPSAGTTHTLTKDMGCRFRTAASLKSANWPLLHDALVMCSAGSADGAVNAGIALCQLLTRLYSEHMPPIKGLLAPFTSVLTRLSNSSNDTLAQAAADALEAMRALEELTRPPTSSTNTSMLNDSTMSGIFNMSQDFSQSMIADRSMVDQSIMDNSISLLDDNDLTYFNAADQSVITDVWDEDTQLNMSTTM